MLRTTGLALAIVATVGCVSTQDRPKNAGELTYASQEVRERVAQSANGRIDTRKESDIRCRRFRMTGTHMVTRVCYTKEEEEALTKATQDTVRDRFGKQSCLDRTLGGACSNGSPQDPFAGIPGKNPGGGF